MSLVKLYPYQEYGAKWLNTGGRFKLLFDDMGLGKSAQAITASKHLNKILIVCPASVKLNWKNEFKKFANRAAFVTNVKDTTVSNIVITNYEQITLKLSTYTSQRWDLIVFDESHLVKEPSSQRTVAVFGRGGLIHTSERIWCLSGTPAPNNVAEIWVWMNAFSLTQLTYNGFLDRYCNFEKANRFTNAKVTGTKTKHIGEVRMALATLSLRRLKRNVLKDLPFAQFSTFELPPTNYDPFKDFPDLRDKMRDELQLLREKTGQDIPQVNDEALIEVLQLMSQSISSIRRYHGLKKMKAVCDVIEYELENKCYEKIVLMAAHTDIINYFEKRLKKYGVVTYTGKHSERKKQQAVDSFQNDKQIQVFIGNIKAAGVGITLTAAHNLAFIEYDFVPGVNRQAGDRVHRIPQKLSVNVRFFSMAGIDHHIARSVQRKTAEISTFIEQ